MNSKSTLIQNNLSYLIAFSILAFIFLNLNISCNSDSDEIVEDTEEESEEMIPIESEWIKLDNFPGLGRTSSFHFSNNNDGYIGLGFDEFGNPYRDVWKYNKTSGEWQKMNDFPGEARGVTTSFFINDIFYVGMGTTSPVGSDTNLNDFWKYNPANDEWSKLKDFPDSAITNGVNVAINEQGYLIGGLVNKTTFVKSVWKYDPQNDSWSRLNDIPITSSGRAFATGFAINGKLFFGLGTDASQNFNDFWEYAPSQDNWQQIANFPGDSRISAISFSLDAKGYILLGRNSDFRTRYNDFWEYNTGNGEWSSLKEFPIDNLSEPAFFTLNNQFHLVNGTIDGNRVNDFWRYVF